MKRIYMILTLLSVAVTGAFAQKSIDLQAVIQFPLANASIGPGQLLDTNKVLCGLIYNGPDDIITGEEFVYYMTSFSTPADDSLTYLDGVSFGQDIVSPEDSGKVIFIFPNANQIGKGHVSPFVLTSDSIRGLYNWDQWNTNDSIVLIRPPYTPGTAYGFFFRAVRVADANTGDAIATDPVPGNNRAVQKIIWSTGGTDIKDMFAKKESVPLSLYPNPATKVVNFDFNFAKPSHASVIVRDITGKTVIARNLGRTQAGKQTYTVDISALSTGNYTLELDTDEQHAVSKLSVSKQ